jgi:transcriptional regulator of acetoin/glycerol metabolism
VRAELAGAAAWCVALGQYAWPGNVRELRNVVESMFLMSEEESIGLQDLPPEIGSLLAPRVADKTAGASPDTGKLEDLELDFIRKTITADGGNLTLVAKHLGIAKSTLYLKLKKYGLTPVAPHAHL